MIIDRPTVADAIPLARTVLDRCDSGCCLHIVLDDKNISDYHVEYCIGLAIERGHEDCEELARTLMRMTKSQRARLRYRV